MDHERRTNRSCTIGALWTAAVFVVLFLVGLTGAFGLSPGWVCGYMGVNILSALSVAVYAKRRDYRGSEIKHLMVFGAMLVPAGMTIASQFGILLMPLPIIVAGRYFSRRFVWHTYANTVLLAFLVTALHARYGLPSYPVCDEAREVLQEFLDGRLDRFRYWRYLVIWCYPSVAVCLSFFAIVVSRLCKDHLETMTLEAKTNARLADVEKGLFWAATA